MNTIKISIIVPIYNAQEFLRKCLDSLVSQSLKDIEMVLVNDGSTDSSLKIVEEYAKKDKRIRILNKKNTGYGDSVNKGIMMAKGNYIGIVEPDDFCSNEMFEKLFDLAEKHKADIARGNYYYFSKDETRKMEPLYMKSKGGIIRPLRDYGVFYEPPAIWSAIYRRDYLKKNEIDFLNTPGASYQDAGFHFKTLACANCIIYSNEPLYYYRIDNPNSSVKSLEKTMAIVEEYKSIEDFVNRLEDNDLLMKYCQVAKFGRYHWNLLRLKKKDAKIFARLMKNEFREKKELGQIKKQYFPKKYWISLKALLSLPVNIYLCLVWIKRIIK